MFEYYYRATVTHFTSINMLDVSLSLNAAPLRPNDANTAWWQNDFKNTVFAPLNPAPKEPNETEPPRVPKTMLGARFTETRRRTR